MVDRQRMINEFMALVQIDSASRQERLIADALLVKMQELGYTMDEDKAGEAIGGNAGNLFVRIPGTVEAPTVMFCAHMDRVTPGLGIKPKIEGDRIVSDGTTILAADDLAGVVQILEALRILQAEKRPHGPIEILFTISEEGGLFGAKNFDRSRSEADVAYFLDGGGDVGNLIVQAPAQSKVNVKVIGKAAHAGIEPEKGISAMTVAAHAIAKMKLGRIDAETTANIGIVSGGSATNIVMDTLEIRAEARSLSMQKLREQTDHMKRTFEETAQAMQAQAEVVVEESYPSYNLEAEDLVVRLAAEATRRLGREAKLIPTGGGSDANILNGRDLPSMVLANGLMNAHRLDEYVLIEELIKGAEQVLEIIAVAAEMKS